MTLAELEQAREIQLVLRATDFVALSRQIVSECISQLNDKPQPEEPDGFYTREQAAAILHVHPRTIDGYIRNGVLESIKKGKRVLIKKSSINGKKTE